MSRAAPVMIMAGGTGGHVFPALAVAERLDAHAVPVVWLGTHAGLEAKLVPQAGIPIEWIQVSGLRGNGLWSLAMAPFMVARAMVQAAVIFMRRKPRMVLGMGGFASGPGGLAARCLRIPLVVHEQNAVAGTTNRWLARVANRVLEAFPDSFPPARHALLVGNPVRAAIAALPPPIVRFAGRNGSCRLLVLGGSQGARALNRLVPQALARLPFGQRPEVWHQSGERTHADALAAYAEAGVEARVQPFIGDMAQAYAWADLVLCRAGALTIAELTAAGVGSVLVPYPYAIDDHQTANARFLERDGAATLVAERELTPEHLAALLRTLSADREQLLKMAESARRLAKTNAAEQVATICLEQAKRGAARMEDGNHAR